MDKLIIDGKGLIAGRIGTQVAQAALHGKEVHIVNAEHVCITGTKPALVAHWKRKYSMGVPRKGPFVHRHPDRFLRRIIRGMLPTSTNRGRDAFKRIMCHIGVPKSLESAKKETIANANVSELPAPRYMTVGQICRELGGDWK